MTPSGHQIYGGARPRFLSTAWTGVLSAAQEGAPEAHDSLAELCRTYWRPVHTFILHQHHSAQDAEDLTQEFFAQLLTDCTSPRRR